MQRPIGKLLFALVALVVIGLPQGAFGVGAFLHKSGAIQVTANGQFVWVVNPDHDSVTRITVGGSFYLVSQFPLTPGERHKPQGLAISANNLESVGGVP